METAANPPAPPGLAAALNRLWTRFLPEIRERVTVLESATRALAANALTSEERDAAHAAAHKLAGVLGTFNLEHGTELARQLELFFAAPPDGASDPAAAPRLAEQTAALRTLIESRK